MGETLAKTDRREEIRVAAATLFATNGVQATTMGQVAEAVGIQKASLYYFFTSKEQLVGAIIRPAVEAMCAEIQSIADSADLPEQQLRDAIAALAGAFDRYGNEMVILVRERLHVIVDAATYRDIRQLKAQYTTVWGSIIDAGERNGTFRAGDSQLRAFAMIGALNWMYAWYTSGGYDIDTVIDTFVQMFLYGVADA